MTPLQILCSFQIWNAKPISVKLHKGLSEVASYPRTHTYFVWRQFSKILELLLNQLIWCLEKGGGQYSEPRRGSKRHGHKKCRGRQRGRCSFWVGEEFTCKLSLSIFLNANLKKVNHSLHQGQLLQFFWQLLEDTIKLWRWSVFKQRFRKHKKEKTNKMADLYPSQVFKRFFDTNFLIENKFNQTILHMVLKAGYNNKVWSKLFSSDIALSDVIEVLLETSSGSS